MACYVRAALRLCLTPSLSSCARREKFCALRSSTVSGALLFGRLYYINQELPKKDRVG